MGLYRVERAGFSVPRFFVVTSIAWRSFGEPAVAPFLQQIGTAATLDDKVIRELSRSIEDTFEHCVIAADAQAAIARAWSTAGFTSVAVRSSATAEDLAHRSYAGVYESFLDVSFEHLIDRIRRCWASLFSHRALRYSPDLYRGNLPAMAVIIQEMKQFQWSGVIFTVDPVSRRHVLVEATPLITPEPIVAGRLSPARVLFDRYLDVVEISGADDVPMEPLRKAAEVALRIEAALGAPQDIEFGVVDGAVSILQSRPITTLSVEASTDLWTTP